MTQFAPPADDPDGAPSARDRVAAVLRLAVPSAAELMLGMLVGLVNTYLVGYLGAASLTAVGLSSQWAMVGSVLFSAVGTGATALVARMAGARQWADASRVLGQALIVAVAMGALAVVGLELTAGAALRLMGAEPEALALGVPYLRVVSSVYVLTAVMFIGNACLRGAGDTRTPMWVMGAVNLTNLAVSWTLIHGVAGLPRLGVMGAAVGEVMARLVGAGLVLAVLLRGRAGMRLSVGGMRFDAGLVRRMLRVGLPAGVEQLVFRFGMLLYARVVSSLGTAAFAAHQVALNGESLSYMPGFGFAVAATTLVGQGLGGRAPARAARDGHTAFLLAAALMSAMGVAFAVGSETIIGFFTTDPEVIAQGVEPLRLIALAQPFLAAVMVYGGGLRGAGDTFVPMLINGGAVWVVRVPAALLLTQVLPWGLTGAWVAMALDLSVRGVLLGWRFQRGAWQRLQV